LTGCLQRTFCKGISAARQIFEPELKLAQAISTHHHKRFFTGTGYIQQVTDQENKNYKKPHGKHNTPLILIFQTPFQ
jgi:hypothetical protein